jgi:hypothetical protein
MRCPLCGEKFNPVDAMLDAEWLEILSEVLPTFGAHAKPAFEYVEKFGVNPLRMKSKKILRLLKEVSKLFTSGRYSYHKKTYFISKAGVVEAFGIVNNKHFDNPIENHNYLKKVMIGISDRELKEVRDKQDRALRKRESGIRNRKASPDEALAKPDDDCISIGEFARQTNKDVATLANMVGRKMK